MSKHTPGPWRAAVRFNPHQFGVNTVADGSKFVAITGDLDAPDEDESIANSLLIAAAPELLSACKLALDALEQGHWQETRNEIHAAIAKAEGTDGPSQN